MFYTEHGSGEPLIFLHGGLSASSLWKPEIISILAQNYRVITPDSRAHGRTDNPAGELSYSGMADDIAAFVEVLGLEKPFIGGWSDGGQIALEIGMRHPDLAKALVVGGAWHHFTDTYRAGLKMLGFMGAGNVEMAIFDQAIEKFGLQTLITAHHHGADYYKTLVMQISYLWMTDPGYSSEDFQKISVPTLILLGDRDALIPVEQAVDMYRWIPNSELAIVNHIGHELPREKSETFAALILEFLLRLSNS